MVSIFKGIPVFYKLFINYLKVKLFQLLVNRLKGSQFMKSKNMKSMTMLSYGLELLGTYFLNKRKK